MKKSSPIINLLTKTTLSIGLIIHTASSMETKEQDILSFPNDILLKLWEPGSLNTLSPVSKQCKVRSDKLTFRCIFNRCCPIHELLPRFPNLTILDKCSSMIKDHDLLQLLNLTQLNLRNNSSITDAAISKLTKLTTLNLVSNKTITNKGIENLPSLTSLDLGDNERITDDGIEKLTNLTHLNLSKYNKITDDALSQLTNITSLILCDGNIPNNTITDKSISKLTKLTHFIIGDETVTNIGISQLTNLTDLSIRDNRVITDEGLGKAPSTLKCTTRRKSSEH